MKIVFALAILVASASALSPSLRAVQDLATDLRTIWGESRLNQSTAEMLAEEQLNWILENKNFTSTIQVRELEPMLSDCPQLAPRTAPSNIADLHPQDIKVVAAIGDSISTGCNALSNNWWGMKDYQGISYSMGGDSAIVTLPNMLQQYSPHLTGMARGTGKSNTGFNFAKNGAIVQDLPAQAAALITTLKSHKEIDFDNDWKVVTVLIGGNNLCDVCHPDDEHKNNAATYEKYLLGALTTLSSMPRTFVNLVAHTDYTQLAKYKGPFCGLALRFVCDCLSTTNAEKQQRTQQEIAAFNAVLDKIAPGFRRDDFAVVVQRSLTKAIIPDDSYISNADCFHPSGEGQRLFATALWNSMILPQSQKASYVATVNDVPNCADANTRLYVD